MRYNQNRMWKNTGSSFAQQVTLSATAVYPPPSLHTKAQHRWMQCFSVGCGRDGRLLLMLFLSFHRLCCGADFTSGVVVEETVVCAGFRVCVPERRSTETKRRELYLPLGESLVQLSLQSLDEPPKERTHRHGCKTPPHLTELFMSCTVCWVADKVQKSLRQDRRGKQHKGILKLPCIDFLFLLLPPLQLCGPLLLPPQPLQLQLPSVLQPPFFSQLQMPLQPPLFLQTKPFLLCFDASGQTKIRSHHLHFIAGYPDILSHDQDHDTEPHNSKRKWWENNSAVTLRSFWGASCAVGSLSLASSQHSCTCGGASGNEPDAAETETRVMQLHWSAQVWQRPVLATCFFCSSSDSKVRGQSTLGELMQDWKLGSETSWECVLESRNVNPGGYKRKRQRFKVNPQTCIDK